MIKPTNLFTPLTEKKIKKKLVSLVKMWMCNTYNKKPGKITQVQDETRILSSAGDQLERREERSIS